MTPDMQDPATYAFREPAMERVRSLLRDHWDPDGALQRGAAIRGERDPAAPRTLDDFTAIVCGILGAGGTKGNVVEYLRGEEAALLGAVRSSPRALGTLGRAAWLAVRGLDAEPAGTEDC